MQVILLHHQYFFYKQHQVLSFFIFLIFSDSLIIQFGISSFTTHKSTKLLLRLFFYTMKDNMGLLEYNDHQLQVQVEMLKTKGFVSAASIISFIFNFFFFANNFISFTNAIFTLYTYFQNSCKFGSFNIDTDTTLLTIFL